MMFITGLAFLLSRHLCVQNVVCVCVCCVCVVWRGEGDQFDTLYQWMGTVDC